MGNIRGNIFIIIKEKWYYSLLW